MKRIVTLLLAAGLVMGAYTGAQAADIKVSGQWNFGFNFGDSTFTKDSESDFNAVQRLRSQIDIIASENLKGVVYFEIGNTTWGKGASGYNGGGALGTDGISVEVRRSYVDWTVPNSDLKIRMGLQGLALPGAAFGSPLLDDDVAALTMSYAFSDEFALTAFWARPFDTGTDGNDEMDMFGLVAPISFDGHSISPYLVYSTIGNAAGITTADANAYWFGVAYTMSAFDPFTLDVDFIYGDLDSDLKSEDASGWIIDFKAAYALDFMTPALLGWYASADKEDGIMPYLNSGAGWAPTSFGFAGSCFAIDSALDGDTGPQGTWGLGIEVADISFMEDLSHVVRVVYVEANEDKSNASDLPLLKDGDSAIEFNLDSTYKIYDNFKFILELGYIDLDLKGSDTEAATKATFNFIYSF